MFYFAMEDGRVLVTEDGTVTETINDEVSK
ncbi:hypothetical protein KGEDBEEJ_02257 [Aeromonas hydrophila]